MSESQTTFDPEASAPRRGCGRGILMIVAGLGVIVLLTCCGGGVAMYFWGTGAIAEMVANQVSDNPVIVEHIGEIQEFDLDLMATAENDSEDDLVFSVRGAKGSGTVVVNMVDGQTELVTRGRLVMEDGTEYDLFPDEP